MVLPHVLVVLELDAELLGARHLPGRQALAPALRAPALRGRGLDAVLEGRAVRLVEPERK